MSKAGKILFSFSILAFLILGSGRLVYGGWHPALWVPFGLMFVFFAGGVASDHKAIREIFALRTTKHGLNMGALIVMVLVGLVCVNYLASRYEKKFDWTSDHFNSLSEQSIKAAKDLKVPTELLLLYRKDATGGDQVERQAKTLVEMYKNQTSNLTFKAYDGLQRPDLAQKYEFQYGAFVFYAIQGEKKVKIDPLTEEGLTRALVKLNREKKKVIYFTRGHGELLIEDKQPGGISVLKDDLSVTYDVKPLALFETGNKVPEDADAVAVIGPKQQFLEGELNGLREYARRGGHLLLAIDPGLKHNLGQLTKTLGVDFDNDYVLDLRSRQFHGEPTLILGTDFSHNSDITKAFKQTGNEIALFELASSLKKATDAPAGLQFDELIKTDATTASVNEIKESVQYKPNGPHTLAISVSGSLPPAASLKGTSQPVESSKEFAAVIFGDSDFLANRLIHNNLNRDLIENSFAWLTHDADLITIRPKQPKGTHLEMPTGSYYALVLSLLLISVVLFGSSIGIWIRRRTA